MTKAKKVKTIKKTRKISSIAKDKKLIKYHKKNTKVATKTIKCNNHTFSKLSKSKVEKIVIKASNGIITITIININTKNKHNNSIVEFHNVSKTIDKTPIFENISFVIPKGSISIITGKSGVGKTTISRIIHGIDEKTDGKILIDGTEMTKKNKNKLRKKTAFVFQNFNLFPHMDVLKNIIYTPIKVYKMPKDKIVVKAHELLEQFGMSNYKHSYPHQLSGGQKQRVAIIRALMISPELLIMDEPTASLDPDLSKDVAKMIKNINKQGLSIMIITHDRLFVDNLLKIKK